MIIGDTPTESDLCRVVFPRWVIQTVDATTEANFDGSRMTLPLVNGLCGQQVYSEQMSESFDIIGIGGQ